MFLLLIFSSLAAGIFGTNIPCSYKFTVLSGYQCILKNASISVTTENEPMNVTGTHIDPYTVNEVGSLYFASPQVLNFVPTKIFEIFVNLKTFGIFDVNLTTITKNAFANCLKLTGITIASNNFPVLPESFAESCVNLKFLSFHFNNIETVHKNAFKGLRNLLFLAMTGNLFEYLDPSTFIHTSQLALLNLSNGRLKTLHPDMFATLTLSGLLLSRNKIKILPALKFVNISELERVDLDLNQISAIDPDFLTFYPGDLENFELLLNENNCTDQSYYLPDQLFMLQPCFDHFLDLSTTASPCASCSSRKICRYYRDHDEVYSCVISGVNLSLLTIGGDHETINGMNQTDADVKAVYIVDSVLSRVPSVIFSKFPNTEFLSISKTEMTIIDDNTFDSCDNLKRLDVSGNHISKVISTSLQKCQKLETINLSGNPVEELDTELFRIDPHLKHVILIQKP